MTRRTDRATVHCLNDTDTSTATVTHRDGSTTVYVFDLEGRHTATMYDHAYRTESSRLYLEGVFK